MVVNFGVQYDQDHITTSSSGSNTVGASYSLMCSSILHNDSIPLPNNIPAPTFVWSFGPSDSDPLPSGVTDMGTTSGDNITFTSTLQFSSLSQCYIGNYTCRLGPGRLVNSTMVTVNGIATCINDFNHFWSQDINKLSFSFQGFHPLIFLSRSLVVK